MSPNNTRAVVWLSLALAFSTGPAAEAAPAPAGPAPAGQAPASDAAPVAEKAGTAVRTGDHPGFGRIVFDLPKNASYDLVTEGDRLLVVFKGAGAVERPAHLPRNVATLEAGPNTMTLRVAQGTRPKPVRMGDRLVLDLLDPAAPADAGKTEPVKDEAKPESVKPDAGKKLGSKTAAKTEPRTAETRKAEKPAPGKDAALAAPVPDAHPAHAEPAVPPSTANRRSPEPEKKPVTAKDLPPEPPHAEPTRAEPTRAEPTRAEPTRAEPSHAEPNSAGAPIVAVTKDDLDAPPAASAEAPAPPVPVAQMALLPADIGVGAAAFRRGGFGLVVLDRRLPLQAPPELEGATITRSAVSTTMQVPLGPNRSLKVTRVPRGWSVEAVDKEPQATMVPQPTANGLGLPFARPGRAVATLDPATGGTLLVGTSLASGPEAAVQAARRMPDYALLPTWLGVAVEPAADLIDLHNDAAGFVLTGSASEPTRLAAVVGGRRFDLPDEPALALLNRLKAQLASASTAPPRARTRDRVAAAQAMIALGMGVEAQSLMELVAADDPQSVADAQVPALGAVGAVLAGRLDEASALDDPRLDDSAEILLWRGVRDRQLGRDTAAARTLATAVPLALAYPRPLRRHVWPEVAEAAVESGTPVPVDQLPRFAKAMLLERSGKVDEALAAYQALEAGTDRLNQVRAGLRIAELQLAAGRFGPAQAADAVERQIFAWRGDAREARIRMRAAELRAAAGGWRAALDSLRETEKLFPDQRAAIQSRKTMVFEAMLSAEGGALSPLEVVLLAADYADCVPDGAPGAALAALLVEKLTSLDLPARAIPVLQGLMQGAPAGPARSQFGMRLAQDLLDGGDGAGALAALDASASPGLPEPLQTPRTLLRARAQAASGDLAGAVAGLTEAASPRADDLRATLLANAKDWQGSLWALTDLAAKVVPRDGPLPDDAQDVLLRQATMAVQVPDPARLRLLEREAARMTGARGDLFRVLTAAPLSAASQLPRAARELTSLRTVPQRLSDLGARPR